MTFTNFFGKTVPPDEPAAAPISDMDPPIRDTGERFVRLPDEENPEQLLKRIEALERDLGIEKERSRELQAGITRMAVYLGVLHILKEQ